MFNGTQQLIGVLRQWRVWGEFGVIEVHRQHARSVIGPLWTILQAIFWIGLIGIVFRPLFVEEFPAYLSYVAVAVLVYNAAAHVLGSSSDAIVRYFSMAWNTPLNIMLFPMMTISSGLYKMLLQLPVVMLTLWFDGQVDLSQIWMLLPTLITFFIFLTGTALLFSVMGAFSGDFRFAVQLSMRFLFFATPIFWIVPDGGIRRAIAIANPLTHFLDAFRSCVIDYEYDPINLAILGVASLLLLCVSVFIFNATRNRVLVAI